MKLNRYILLPLLAAATVLSGCSDFLEPKSQYEFVPKDAQSMDEILLYGAYPRRESTTDLNMYLNLLDDDIDGMGKYLNTASGSGASYRDNQNGCIVPFTWQGHLYTSMKQASTGLSDSNTDIYGNYYQFIKYCNAVMDYMDQVNPNEHDRNRLMGQALALRGFFYLMLTNLYGQPYNESPDSPGVPLKLTSFIEDKPMVRNTVAQCYTQILADLHAAEKCYEALPAEEQWQPDMRASLPMVQLLLSRTYLYMENWTDAAKYAKKVMDDPRFSLEDLNLDPSFSASFTYNTYASSEAIWIYGNVTDMTSTDNKWMISYPGTSSSLPQMFRASDSLVETLSENPSDIRAKKYLVPCGRKYYNNVIVPLAMGKVVITPSNLTYSTTSAAPKPVTSDFTELGRALRLSEAYLNYMEAEANAGHTSNALDALDDLRVKRIATAGYTREEISDKDQLVAFIHNERRRELCYEGQRWFDLRRWGMPSITHKLIQSNGTYLEYVLEDHDPFYVLPIPDKAMDRNAYLTQNPLATSPRVAVNAPTEE